MNDWLKENSDKLVLLVLVIILFVGAFVAARLKYDTILAAGLDNMKYVMGALIGLITGFKLGQAMQKPPSA